MAKQYTQLKDSDIDFIKQQHMFFVASCSDKEVNLSPRGYDSLHVQSSQKVFFYDYYGSGNRTSQDIKENGELTMMFCSFGPKPKILRLFAKGEVINRVSEKFQEYMSHFSEVNIDQVRQIIVYHIYAVESSCGYAVPMMNFQQDRPVLREVLKSVGNNDDIQKKMSQYAQRPNLVKLRAV
ncbi:pyridoxamine 5'-phosphate oxidase family protein [bacterium]|nr:pyridoxamine 5'-phosphate oxidase family protein [bacterium]